MQEVKVDRSTVWKVGKKARPVKRVNRRPIRKGVKRYLTTKAPRHEEELSVDSGQLSVVSGQLPGDDLWDRLAAAAKAWREPRVMTAVEAEGLLEGMLGARLDVVGMRQVVRFVAVEYVPHLVLDPEIVLMVDDGVFNRLAVRLQEARYNCCVKFRYIRLVWENELRPYLKSLGPTLEEERLVVGWVYGALRGAAIDDPRLKGKGW